MKTALVIDWMVTSIGGAEKLNQSICEIFHPDIFTLVKDEKELAHTIFERYNIKSSFIQRLPFAKKKYRSYLPLFPLAIEQFDVSNYDLVISSSHSIAKGIITHSDQLHICYCNTPIRYAWDLYYQYLSDAKLKKGIKGALAKFFLHYIRQWDYTNSVRVDEFIANSKCVAKRIKKIYGRESKVIYPPVNTSYFSFHPKKDNYYVAASRLVPYKKIDLIVDAFSKLLDHKLLVIGDGPQKKQIMKKATKNIEILGSVSDSELKTYLQNARGFIFASHEDFGILPVEAQSCGTPVIAYKKGGALETVIDQKTGVFFDHQTPESLIGALKNFEKNIGKFDLASIRAHALKFDVDYFKKEMKQFIVKKYLEYKSRQ
jgi:glycosyltransferase involved in cell wall biosynthesis